MEEKVARLEGLLAEEQRLRQEERRRRKREARRAYRRGCVDGASWGPRGHRHPGWPPGHPHHSPGPGNRMLEDPVTESEDSA